jgi:hypothetical protein
VRRAVEEGEGTRGEEECATNRDRFGTVSGPGDVRVFPDSLAARTVEAEKKKGAYCKDPTPAVCLVSEECERAKRKGEGGG